MKSDNRKKAQSVDHEFRYILLVQCIVIMLHIQIKDKRKKSVNLFKLLIDSRTAIWKFSK